MKKNNHGFTLIELLVVIAISGVVMAGIYSVYYSQQKSYIVQDEVAGMQQNLRTALFHMSRDIRMAGCDPTGNANAGFTAASATSISFTEDIRGKDENDPPDGDTADTNESITYSLGGGGLQRNGTVIADNIDALDFICLNATGAVTASLLQIRSVQVTIVARTEKGDPGFTNNTKYYNQQGTEIYTAPGDNNRRRLLTSNINCRNL
jgi:type IV pilus assembly protein PilW